MASTREIKARIKSVKDTQKITNAMYLIATTKLRHAKAELEKTRPYFDALRTELWRLFALNETMRNRYCRAPDPDMPSVLLVITADRGLAGAYNQNVIKLADRLMNENPGTHLMVVGEVGRQYFTAHGESPSISYPFASHYPLPERARSLAAMLLELFDSGNIGRVEMIYTDMKNSLSLQPVRWQLLPLPQVGEATFTDTVIPEEKPFDFFPSVEVVLGKVMPSFLSGYIYGALTDSYCCEQSARMTAMDAANKNATELLAELTMEYNRVRQAAITQEITEVTACARAQRLRRVYQEEGRVL